MNKSLRENLYARDNAGFGIFFPRTIRNLPRAISRFRRTAICAAVLALIVPLAARAQNNAIPARIAARINENRLMTLRGNTHPLARPQNDQGRVDPSVKMERMTMMFQRTAAQQADLDALLSAQQNPTSSSFHQWLTPAQFGDRFGIAPTDLQKVTAWLQAHGLAVVETPNSKNFIVFEGAVAQVESAFHMEMRNYATSDAKFYANSGEPSVPADLAAVVAGFRGLNNYRLKPRPSIRNSLLGRTPSPNFTSGISGNNFVAPGDFAKIYDLDPLYTSGIDGTGQKIVVIGQSNIVLADIAAFRTAAGLAANAPVVTLVPTSTDPGVLSGTGDEQESSIDIEWAGAVAKNATIDFVYSGNGVNDALFYAVNQNFAPVISVSYGNCEAMNPLSEIESFVSIAQQANSQGITIVSSVGDGGATDCDADLLNYPAFLGLSVDLPASLPYVTGVGGTEFNEGGGTFWQTTPTPNGPDILTSAIGYIPEKAWNDSSQTNGLLAGGGGASTVFGKPTWQTGTGVPTDSARDVPDISLNASPVHDPYLACVQFTPQNSSTFTSSCLKGTFRYSDTTVRAYGGTSFGAPTFAGILALINQKTASAGQGNVNYILYPLAASTPTAFHDITVGDNTSACVAGTQDCTTAGSIGFSTATAAGYDQATGLGSIDAAILVNAWSSISTGAGSTPTLSSISPTTIAAGSSNFPLTATGSNFATNAQILWNGSTSGVTMLSGGTATTISATISSNLVAFGTTASVTVTDDAAKAGESSASQPFTVTGTPPGNDHIAGAIAMTINSTSAVDNSAATTDSTDPTPRCALTGPVPSTNPRTKTVWWSLTSATTQSLIVSTIGSVYDTTLSVWTGAPGSLTNVACNDDVSSGQYTQSLLSFSATAGTTYYIMVAPFGPPDSAADQAGGKTVLNVSIGNLSSITATPSSQTVAAGSSATFIVTDVGSASFPLTCSGLPTGAACTPVTVNAGSTASLVITTKSRAAVVPLSITKKRFHLDLWPMALALLGISLFSFCGVGRLRVLRFVPLGAMVLLLVLFATGCGSSSSSGGGTTTNPNGTPAGTYKITITGSASVSTSVTLTVT